MIFEERGHDPKEGPIIFQGPFYTANMAFHAMKGPH